MRPGVIVPMPGSMPSVWRVPPPFSSVRVPPPPSGFGLTRRWPPSPVTVMAGRTGIVGRIPLTGRSITWSKPTLDHALQNYRVQALDVGFVSLREGIDLNTPVGRLMLVVLAGVSQYETEVRKERQLAGIAKAKAEGKKWGGRKPGTHIKLSVEKEALIRQLHAEDKAIAVIARLVGLSRKSVYKALEPRRKVA